MSKINKSNSRIHITAEQTIIIIRLIKKYKCIWDRNHPDFRKRLIRYEAFKKIGGYFNISAEDLIKKYQRFRNGYMHDLRQIRDKKKTHSNLFYFDEMDFLRSSIEHRSSVGRVSSPSFVVINAVQVDDSEEEMLMEEEFPLESLDESQISEQESIHSTGEENEDIPKEPKDIADQIEPQTLQPDTIELEPDIEECLIEETHEEKEPEKEPTKIAKADEFSIFAEYLASQLRTMDELSALETMEELQRIIFRRKIQILKKDCTVEGSTI